MRLKELYREGGSLASRIRAIETVMDTLAKFSVLVVEDEPLVRLALEECLKEAGYLVHSAGSAEEAIAVLEKEEAIRLVFTDVRMPGEMDGLALARVVRERWPPTIIVICSGNEERSDLEDVYSLEKPYTLDQLATLLKIIDTLLLTVH